MKHFRWHLRPELLRVPCAFAAALCGGFLLSMGTVSGVVSTLAAALAGIVQPLYAMTLLLGALISFGVQGAPPQMHFLLTSLVLVTMTRVLFRESYKPHMLAFMTAFSCTLGSFLLYFVFYAGSGNLPLYLFEAVLTGIAAYFLADARDALREQRRIVLRAGKTFTYALCYLLCITALCGADLPFCNIGRIVGMSLTLLFAKQMRYTGGTLVGALTSCGVTLCSVSLGTPVLFLPVTGMMAGFSSSLPNALYIPVFFILQALSSAVLDSSLGLVKLLAELSLSCGIYALICNVNLYRFLSVEHEAAGRRGKSQMRFLSDAVGTLQSEASEIMHRLSGSVQDDSVMQIRRRLCTGCKNHSFCWSARSEQSADAIRELLHSHRRGIVPEALDGCIRRVRLLEVCAEQSSRNALAQMQRVHLEQSRQVTLEHLQILADVAQAAADGTQTVVLTPQTDMLVQILRQCAAQWESAQVCRLRAGRLAAEVFTRQGEFPAASVQTLLARHLGVSLECVRIEAEQGVRICLYQTPPYRLEYAVQSENAPEYERCGDHSDVFTNATGDQYLVLSDGMGSGSTASLASRIAVRTFRRMIESGMRVPTAIRLINAVLLTETGTEHFATLDVLHFHADCGELTLYKSGAAATLFCHAGQVQRISAMSFPVGIVTDALPSRRRTSAYAGDTLVMLSDGIGEAEYPYISRLLREERPLEQIVQDICEKSAVFHGGQSRDDMTVLAARVTSRFQTEFTKNVEEETAKCVENATALSNSI